MTKPQSSTSHLIDRLGSTLDARSEMLLAETVIPENLNTYKTKTYATLFRKEVTILVRLKHKAMNS